MITASPTLPRSSVVKPDAELDSSSPATTIGTLLLAAAVTLTTFDFTIIENVQRFSADWQTVMRLAVCMACGAYGLFSVSYTFGEFFRFPGAWSVLFALWAMFTVPLGIAKTYAAAACLSLLCMTLFAPAVLVRLSGRRIVWTIVLSQMTFIAASWGFYFAGSELGMSKFTMPDGEIIWRVGGDAQQLGFQAAWAIGLMLILGAERMARWPVLLIPLGLAAITLPFTQSRTAMLAAVAVVTSILARRMSFLQALGLGLIVLLAGAVSMLVLPAGVLHVDVEALQEKVSRSGNPEELYNLTGRTEIWQYVIARWEESPILGWGYGCSRHVLARYAGGEYGAFDLHHAHNLLLNITLCTGAVGGLLLVAMLVHQLFWALGGPEAVPDAATVFILVAGITEPLLFGPMPRAHTVIWLLALFWRQCGVSLQEASDV
jgi:O-antigen ligase